MTSGLYLCIYRYIYTHTYVRGVCLDFCVWVYICTHIHIYRVQDISRWLSHSLLLGNCSGKCLFGAGRIQQQGVGALVPCPLLPTQKYMIKRWPKPLEAKMCHWWGGHGKDEEFKGSEFFRGRRNTSEVIYLQAIPSQEKKISTGRSSYWLQLGEILWKRKKSYMSKWLLQATNQKFFPY